MTLPLYGLCPALGFPGLSYGEESLTHFLQYRQYCNLSHHVSSYFQTACRNLMDLCQIPEIIQSKYMLSQTQIDHTYIHTHLHQQQSHVGLILTGSQVKNQPTLFPLMPDTQICQFRRINPSSLLAQGNGPLAVKVKALCAPQILNQFPQIVPEQSFLVMVFLDLKTIKGTGSQKKRLFPL